MFNFTLIEVVKKTIHLRLTPQVHLPIRCYRPASIFLIYGSAVKYRDIKYHSALGVGYRDDDSGRLS